MSAVTASAHLLQNLQQVGVSFHYTDMAPSRVDPVVHSDPNIMGGTTVFVGTRVPFQTLLDYLEAGDPLAEFLEDFPTVTREQAVASLEQAKDALLARAHSS